jgi:hypothetical protein
MGRSLGEHYARRLSAHQTWARPTSPGRIIVILFFLHPEPTGRQIEMNCFVSAEILMDYRSQWPYQFLRQARVKPQSWGELNG